MYCIVNLETRSVLSYPDHSTLLYANEALAQHHAAFAQHLTNHPHTTLPTDGFSPLRVSRTPAPWFN